MPHRADTVLARVRAVGLGEVATAAAQDSSRYARVHSARYVHFLETAWQEWSALGHQHDALPLVWPVRDLRSDIEPEHIDGKLGFYAMDAGVAITAGTWPAVRASADLALAGMQQLLDGQHSAFALCRPPGHHAAAEYMGGYCYLNNAPLPRSPAWIRVASA
jgi:acetoin utilization deacetylase AcuC-like enzyme